MYTSSAPESLRPKVTVPMLQQMKRNKQRIATLTAYDASFARAMDAAGIDAILVGDSLGMVIKGGENTVSVSIEDMLYHCRCVAQGLQSALLIADMPFQSYANVDRALESASLLLSEGLASMVKMEGAGFVLDAISYLTERDIPVCAHLGLTPQSVLSQGGFKVQGREQQAADRIIEQAKQVQQAGAQLLVLECVPSALAKIITETVSIPTIGIGAGPDCDGQILVSYDALGINSGHRRPRFVKDFLASAGSIDGAFAQYVQDVKSGAFPSAAHGYA